MSAKCPKGKIPGTPTLSSRVCEETYVLVRVLARNEGITPAEWVKDAIVTKLEGELHLLLNDGDRPKSGRPRHEQSV